MPRTVGAALVVLAAVCSCAAGEEPLELPDLVLPPKERLRPLVVAPQEEGEGKIADKPKRTAKPSGPLAPIRVDPEAHTVRLPVVFSRTTGVVEWFLSSGQKHRHTSVLVTAHSVRHLAQAFATAGFSPGTPPVPAGDTSAHPPKGTPVEIYVVAGGPDGQRVRYPANLFLSEKSGGDPIEKGRWIYVGPRVVRAGEAAILVTKLSGSLVTTSLRDASAMIYWVPEAQDEVNPSVRTYFVSGVPLPAEGHACEVQIGLAADKKDEKPAELSEADDGPKGS